MQEPLTVLDVLCDAYGLLHSRGWAKRNWEDDGCLCLQAALHLAAGRTALGTFINHDGSDTWLWVDEAVQRAIDVRRNRRSDFPASVTHWNDHHTVKFDHVCSVLEIAIIEEATTEDLPRGRHELVVGAV